MQSVTSSIRSPRRRFARALAALMALAGATPAFAAADLVVNNNPVTDPVAAGAIAEFTVRVDNNGTTGATSVQMIDTIPAGATYVGSRAPTPGTVSCGAAVGNKVTCAMGNIASGGSASIVIQMRTSGPGTLTNVASATSNEGPAGPAGTDVPKNVNVLQGADLALTATQTTATPQAGSTLGYTFTATNNGPNDATSVRVQASLPQNYAVVAGSLPSACSVAAQTLTCNVPGTLATGASVSYTINGIVGAANGSTLTLTGSVIVTSTSAAQDPDSSNNGVTLNASVQPGTDLKLVKTASRASPLIQGDTFNYVLATSYSGDAPVALKVTDTVPAEFRVNGTPTGTGWSCSAAGQVVTCSRTAATVAGANVALPNITVPVLAQTVASGVANTATASSDTPEINPANNSGSVILTTLAPSSDLQAFKTGPNPALATVGSSFDWAISLKNNGPSKLTGTARMVDTLPVGITVTAYVGNGWTCAPALPFTTTAGDRTMTCTRDYTAAAPLAVNGTSQAVTYTVASNVNGPLTNGMCVSAVPSSTDTPAPDANASNDCVSSGVGVSDGADSADLRVVKTADKASLPAGDVLTYTMEVINDGQSTSKAVVLTDLLDTLINANTAATGAGFISATVTNPGATAGTCSASGVTSTSINLSCNVGDVLKCTAGACPTVTVKVRPGGDGGARTNSAFVVSNITADPDYGNNNGAVTTTTEARADMTVAVSGTPTPATAGQNLTLVYTVKNGDYSKALDAALAAVLPVNTVFVSATPSGGGSCTTQPGANALITGANANLGCSWTAGLGRNVTQTVTVIVRPTDASRNTTLNSTASVSTSTTELDATNNTGQVAVPVSAPIVDLSAGISDSPDPVAVGDNVTLTLTLTNNGPSFAENPHLVANLPASLLSFQSLTSTGVCTSPAVGAVNGTIECVWPGVASGNSLTASVLLQGIAKGNAVQTKLTVSSDETASFESNTANNVQTEGTTVRAKADLAVTSKVAMPTTVAYRDAFSYVVTVTNNGPGAADDVVVNDNLPAGMVLAGTPSIAPGRASDFPTLGTCTGTTGATSFTCALGNDMALSATAAITVPVRVTTAPNANPATYTNTATITTSSRDPVPANDSNSGSVSITTSSLAGSVYADANANGVRDGGENGIAGVTVKLTGTATDGSTVSFTKVTDNAGAYRFDFLPAGTYTITETQPATGWVDGVDVAGTAGGSAGNDVVTAIPLLANKAETGYDFGELPLSGIDGTVYRDLNNDGLIAGAGETGIPGVSVTLTGTDDRGQAVNVTTVTTAAGKYAFDGLRPGTYTVTETQPAGFLGGKATPGTGATTAGTADANGDVVAGITLAVGQRGTAYNFGELPPTGLSGSVFIDANRNGVHDGAETAGVAGVTITLTGTDDLGAAVSLTTTTDAAGGYQFANLRPGTYAIVETQPAQWTDGAEAVGKVGGATRGTLVGNDHIGSIALAAGESGAGYDFGELGQGLMGFVYVDANENGVRDSGEAGIAGVTVTVTNTAGGASETAVTDASGAYAFSNLPAGTYRIAETQPPQYLDGAEQVGSLGGTHAANDVFDGIVLGVSQVGTNYNFGELTARLAGSVFVDADNDGIRDAGEPGLAGVTVTLTGTNTLGQAVNVTVTTDASGNYVFTGLLPSNAAGYTITETQPGAYADGTEHIGSLGGTAGAAGTSVISGIPVGPGAKGAAYDFGERTGGIAGSVYFDANNDGTRQGGEKAIGGVTVHLTGTDVDGRVVDATTTTAADGTYLFGGLTTAGPGGYTVTETQPATYLDGRAVNGKLDGAACAACDVATPNRIGTIPFDPAHTFTEFDFPEITPGSIAGTVYDDIDGNHQADKNEGLGGVTVTLTGIDDQGTSVTKTATTAADGTYTFDGLRPGTYTVTETQPAGLGDVSTHAGNLGGTIATDAVSNIVLTPGTAATGYDFVDHGNVLSGAVYFDKNGNGKHEAGEPGLAGIPVVLSGKGADGSTIARTTTTAADGGYQFAGLVAGTYTVTETQPPLYKDGGVQVGTAGGTAGKNAVTAIVLSPGANANGYDFPELTGADGTIAGTVWLNQPSGNPSSQDPGEPGLPGWSVELYRDGARVPGVAAAVTDAGGHYLLTGVPAQGGYEIRFLSPNGVYYGYPLSQDPDTQWNGTVDHGAAVPEIRGATVGSGIGVVQQDLPLDPSGVIYDSVTRAPLAGARVTLLDPSGMPVPSQFLAGGASNVTQTTGPDGFYQFLLLPGSPTGAYTLRVEPPVGYLPPPSGIHAPAGKSFTVPGGTTTYHLSNLASPPSSGDLPPYYLSFVITPNSVGVAGNHIPVDPVLQGALRVRKTTSKLNVSKGDLVPYTIEVTNTLAVTVPDVAVRDLVPAGFKYRNDSARVDGVAREPVMNGRTLTWPDLTFAPNQTRVVQLVLVIGSGVGEGEYTNNAWALNQIADRVVSNTGTAVVRIVPDATFDCADLIGKVFDDRNGNGYQDQGEPGVPAIRLATPRGLVVTTDAEGRYHVPCADVPEHDRGANYVMKLDERSLPTGYRLTTENPGDVRLTAGKMAKLNFGVALHRVVRLDVSSAAFAGDGNGLARTYADQLPSLYERMKGQPVVLRLAYHLAAGETRDVANKRLRALEHRIDDDWERSGDRPPVVIEQEVIEVQP
ncbi:conserved repeat domain-containing protein [Luteibacter sp. UNCMF331Sha3.1]|nr:conserved repeat domain-containing protein [Luteibacter sp. UNCMF331Sha3.1]